MDRKSVLLVALTFSACASESADTGGLFPNTGGGSWSELAEPAAALERVDMLDILAPSADLGKKKDGKRFSVG